MAMHTEGNMSFIEFPVPAVVITSYCQRYFHHCRLYREIHHHPYAPDISVPCLHYKKMQNSTWVIKITYHTSC